MTTSPDPFWTPLPLSPDSRVVYVDPSGPPPPPSSGQTFYVRTLSEAVALLRDGCPDHLLLRAGMAFDGGFGFTRWLWSGRSASEPMVIGRYGDGLRPILNTGTLPGFVRMGGGASPPSINHLRLTGLDFRAHTYTGGPEIPRGFMWLGAGTDIAREDCSWTGYAVGVSIEADDHGRPSNFRERRCQILDSKAPPGVHAQGLYADGVDKLEIDEPLWDNNGWLHPDIYQHNAYITHAAEGYYGCTGVVVRNPISTRPASHGIQLRPGGTCDDGLYLRCPITALVGNPDYPVSGSFARNISQQATDINASTLRGWGVETKSGMIAVLDNIFSKKLSREPAGAMILGAGGMQMRNIVRAWPGSPDTPGTFVDPERCVELYMASLNLAPTFDAFISRARANRRGAYDARFSAAAVNQYVRAGFAAAGGGA